jgi:hypothetical protein
MAHKGKATSNVTYNPEDGSEAYNNLIVRNRLSEYTAMAKEVHGSDYDPSVEFVIQILKKTAKLAREGPSSFQHAKY